MSRVGVWLASLAAPLLALPAVAEPPSVEAAPPLHRDRGPSGPSLDERLTEIQQRVQAALRYPEAARARGVTGEARVGFEVEPDGRPHHVSLLESSGSAALDRAAERAVHDAGSLPRVVGRVNIPVRFQLQRRD